MPEESTFQTAAMGAEEWFDLSRRMERHHSVFYAMWQMGKPLFTDRIQTAAIGFLRGQPIEFLINPTFWAECSIEKREFILCHEMLHITLNHGVRGKDSKNHDAANVAMDVVVNHTLVDHFGFKRDEIDPKNEACWQDTVFPKVSFKSREQLTFEFYYNKLNRNCQGGKGGKGQGAGAAGNSPKLVDDHSGLFASGDILTKADIEKIAGTLSNEEMEQLKGALEADAKSGEGGTLAGTSAGNLWKTMTDANVKPKRKWETVIKRWADPFMPREDRTAEHWLRTNRRLSLIPDSALLPSEMEEDDKPNEGKIDVLLLLDTSGSCAPLAERFWKAGRSLPKSRFNVTMACFDTRVYPVDAVEKKLYGFGGTSFCILEDYAKKMETYPTAVFVITDGYGDSISPSLPVRWRWFLTSNYRSYIPKECHVYQLEDYE